MCRWLAYTGAPVFLDELICKPTHSLVEQSLCATEAKSPTNGDGFGIGWYGERPEPGLYREVLPAWNDPNLRNLAYQRSEEHTSELQSLMRNSYAVFCLQKKNT